jgi:hypothetical protein
MFYHEEMSNKCELGGLMEMDKVLVVVVVVAWFWLVTVKKW